MPTTPRTQAFDCDWRFQLGDCPQAAAPGFDDSGWRAVQVPHDFSLEQTPSADSPGRDPNGYFPGGIGWYRKHFSMPADGCKVFVQFDGVYHRSDVYLNGVHLGHRPYGYVSFQYDLTPHLRPDGENVLAVRVDHSDCPTSRWYSGSGIYRHVWLTVCDPLHVAQWGTYVTTPAISDAQTTVRVRTTVDNEGAAGAECTLVSEILAPAGEVVATASATQALAAGSSAEFDQSLSVPDPQRWSVETPVLYTLRTTVREGDRVADVYTTPFGIRELRFDRDRGFFLNGEPVKLKGVCLHHDGGCVGAAVPKRMWERRLEVLREIGCNALRTSHNHPAPELLDLCDQMGFLVMDEAFDKWRSGYYEQHYDEWWEVDLDGLLRRDRNHPCVILWSVGNEVAEQGTVEGTARLQELTDYVRAHEPTRPVTYAAHPQRGENSVNNNGFADLLDIVSYNYQEHWFEADRAADPDRLMVSTESTPYFYGRADYGTDAPLANAYCDFAPHNPWWAAAEHDYVLGQFIWAGIDYLGESAGWPSKGWPTGLIDTCGFAKPCSAFHRAAWRTDPVVRIGVLDDSLDLDPGRHMWSWPPMARHWNWPQYAGRLIRVETPSNCETVELLLNDQSLGVRRPADYLNRTVLWYVPYGAGTLRAVACNGGVEAATDELRTAGEPAALALLPDRETLDADGQDVVHLEVQLQDEAGVLVPAADRLVSFTVEGPARLLGTDNGDLRCLEPYQSAARTTYFGRCLAVVQATREAGAITVTATAEGLAAASVSVVSN